MSKSTFRRLIAMGAFGIIGSALAFGVGARLGGALDHHTKSVSVARVPVQDMQPASEDKTPAPVAQK